MTIQTAIPPAPSALDCRSAGSRAAAPELADIGRRRTVMSGRYRLLGVCAFALLVGACSTTGVTKPEPLPSGQSDSRPTMSAVVGETPSRPTDGGGSAAPSAPGASGSATTSPPGTTSAAANKPPAKRATVKLPNFTSPSGNIACQIDDGTDAQVRCDIAESTFTPPAQPAGGCGDTGWGNSIVIVSTSAADFICAGDTIAVNGSPALQYGQTSVVGPFSCDSDKSGITCRNTKSGHYFLLSKATFTLK